MYQHLATNAYRITPKNQSLKKFSSNCQIYFTKQDSFHIEHHTDPGMM